MMKKRKPNLQTRVRNSEKSPVKSIRDKGENGYMKGKSRLKHDLKSNEELILNGLSKAEDWRTQKRRKQKEIKIKKEVKNYDPEKETNQTSR